MQIGKPLRTIVVEPLELPVEQPIREPEPEPIQSPESEPEQVPAEPWAFPTTSLRSSATASGGGTRRGSSRSAGSRGLPASRWRRDAGYSSGV